MKKRKVGRPKKTKEYTKQQAQTFNTNALTWIKDALSMFEHFSKVPVSDSAEANFRALNHVKTSSRSMVELLSRFLPTKGVGHDG